MSSNPPAKRKVMGRIDLDGAQTPSPKAVPHIGKGSGGMGPMNAARSPISSPPLSRATTSSHVRAKVDMSSLGGVSALAASSSANTPPIHAGTSSFVRSRPTSSASAASSSVNGVGRATSPAHIVRAGPFSPHTPRAALTSRPGSPSKLRSEDEVSSTLRRPRLRTQSTDMTPPAARIAGSASSSAQDTTPRSSQYLAAAPHLAQNGVAARHGRAHSTHVGGASPTMMTAKTKVASLQSPPPPPPQQQQQQQQLLQRRSPSPASSTASSASKSPTIASAAMQHGHPLRMASDDSTASSLDRRTSYGSSSVSASRPSSNLQTPSASSSPPATLSTSSPRTLPNISARSRPPLLNTWSSQSGSASTSEPVTPALLSPGASVATMSLHHRNPSSTQQSQTSFNFYPTTPSADSGHVISPSIESDVASPPLDPAESEAASEAKRNRKILDLEITNKSLLAINAGLEVSKLKQAREIRELKRRLREAISGGVGGGLGRAMGLGAEGGLGLGSDEEEEDEGEEEDEEDEEDEVVFKEDEELEAAHSRCKGLIDAMVQRARESILLKVELPPEVVAAAADSGGEAKAGNRVLHPAEIEQLEKEREGEDGQEEEEDDDDDDDEEEDTSRMEGSHDTARPEEDSFDKAVHLWSSTEEDKTEEGTEQAAV